MNILLNFKHSISSIPLLIDVALTSNDGMLFEDTINLNTTNTSLLIPFNIKKKVPQKLKLVFLTTNHDIVKHPLILTNIVLDDFYSIDKILYSGHSEFDHNFLVYAKENQILLEENICDTNRLDFTGNLVYYFEWPFYKNIFTKFTAN